jgi:hypothetical protein
MLIGNIRSNQDLKAKKDLQKQLLELEASNEAESQKRFLEKGPKETEAKKIQEQYKSASEIQKDKANLEKKALENFLDLGFPYTEAGQLTGWLSASARLADFNSIFKIVKKELLANYDKSVITPEFLKNFLDNVFDDLDTNLGKKFSKDVGVRPEAGITSLEYLVDLIPSTADIADLKQALEANRDERNSAKIDSIFGLLNLYETLLPREEILYPLRVGASQNDRMRIVKRIYSLLDKAQFLSRKEVQDLAFNLEGSASRPLDFISLNVILNRLLKQLSYFDNQNRVNNFVKVYADLINLTQTNPNVDIEKVVREVEGKIKEAEDALVAVEAGTDLAREERVILEQEEQERQSAILAEERAIRVYFEDLVSAYKKTSSASLPKFAKTIQTSLLGQYTLREEADRFFSYKGVNDSALSNSQLVYADYVDLLMRLYRRRKEEFEEYDPRTWEENGRPPLEVTDNKGRSRVVKKRDPESGEFVTYGLGAKSGSKVLSKLKKHFKGDEQLLKKVVSALESDSSSDEETAKELSRHQKATAGLDSKLEKLVKGKGDPFGDWISKNISHPAIDPILEHFNPNKGRGVGFKATRIPTKKIGNGVKLEKEDNPTYRQFGKYVIHLPFLLNNNIANFKYPSLGGIPTLKPLTISNDYRDLLVETLQTGKLNKKELERLPQSEIKHFEKVAIGAGLVEQLGIKVGSTDEDKADGKRFEVLRGEYLAGNNNEKLIKELRMLITKFINSGRLHKTEGLNLLLELSTV